MKKFLILDGNSMINRAFYGVKALTRSDGMPTNALYGFANFLKRYLDLLSPDYFACAFDMRAPTFRHKMYDKYKSNRHGMPDELACQMPYAHSLAEAFGATVLETEGYEADDIIGTAAHSADESGEIETYILTGDRDSLQLISDRTTVILMRNREDEIFDLDHFREVYGITPDKFVDVKALMGDTSDCIPGIPGIGEKTALRLIAENGSLDELYEMFDNNELKGTKTLLTRLENGRELAYLSRKLAKICTEAPTGGNISEYSIGKRHDQLISIFRELEFNNLLRKIEPLANEKPAARNTDITKLELECDDFISRLPEGEITVSYDGEALSVLAGDCVIISRSPSDKILMEVMSHPIVCHDFKELCHRIEHTEVHPTCVFDTMLADYLIRPGRGKYTIADTAEGCAVEDPCLDERSPYTVNACRLVLEKELESLGMTDLLTDIEIPLASILADAERDGFKIDADGIHRYAVELAELERNLAASIYDLAGHDFNINSPKQLGTVLFEELALPCGKKTKTGYSTNADVLSALRFVHPIISEILSYRRVSKLRGTYGDALADMADENGRIHTTFNQCGTATGRLSSNDPNLQNIPVREDLGREIRKYFTAENENYVLIDADYSQIELRLLAHLSGDKAMIDAFTSGEDIHTMTAASVFGISPEEVTPDLRRRAKAVNFGIVYGIGAYSLSQDIGTTKSEADRYIKDYFRTYPDVERYLNETVDSAVETGYTVTMFGRRRNIPELSSSKRTVSAFGRRIAMNSPIQGSAADIIKLAMIGTDRALKSSGIDARLIMQVHDELIVESSRSCADKAMNILVREMENAAKLRVPLIAEAAMGDNWFDVK